MRILIVDGPGSQPESYARVLGRALHALGHVIIVHWLTFTHVSG